MLEWLAARVEIYRLLRELFSYPLSAETLQRLGSLEPDAESAPELSAAVARVREALAALPEPALERLNLEHSRLMSGPGLPPAPPFASFYASGSQRLFGAEAQAVARAYRDAGLVPADWGTPPDHISVELDFICLQAEEALTTARDGDLEACLSALLRQHRFLAEHLLPFSRSFCRALREAADLEFFRGAADLLEEYLDLEADALAESLRVAS